ncbi:MAG: Sodium/hydrogen exchanger family-domain-containing protein [Benniella sp.]|nr:MAG: Sodium/hydrogen exchanger family-domain-containing protein [Benniella sp.]
MFPSSLFNFGLFSLSLYLVGCIFEDLFQCRLLGELLIGFIFGHLGQLIPTDKTVLNLAGELGVLALIFEAGLCTELWKVARVGPYAALVGVIGSAVPFLTGFGFIYASRNQYGHSGDNEGSPTFDPVSEAIASGAALASTSIAIAVSIMRKRGILETAEGALITTAAMLDDVISLILLGIVSALGTPQQTLSEKRIGAMTILKPLLSSLGITIIALLGCLAVSRRKARPLEAGDSIERDEVPEQAPETPEVHPECEIDRIDNDKDGSSKITWRQLVAQTKAWVVLRYGPLVSSILLSAMILVGLGYSVLAEYIGSTKFLGAFMAGVLCSNFPTLKRLHHKHVVLTVQPALSAIFFATIGFAIPLDKLLEPTLFAWGVLYAIIGSLSKIIVAAVVPSSLQKVVQRASGETTVPIENEIQSRRIHYRWIVGTAMIARGELGLLIAQQAVEQGVMGSSVMVVSTWSIVLCTLVGISALGVVMNKGL